MAEIIRITDGNAFKLRITGEILLENYREAADMSVVSKLVVNFVRRGRLPQTASVDEQGRIVALNDGSLALGVYGVELTGYYNGEPWRYFSQDVFEIVDENSEANESTGDDVPMYDVTFVVSFGGDSITAAFVEAAISTHNNDVDSHPGITEELSKKVDDIMVDDESVVDVDPETGRRTVNLHKDQLGKVDDVLVNGESVLNEDNEAEITIPEKVSDLPNDADYATKQEAQQMVDDAKIDTVSVDYQEDGGAPDASASFEDGELAFSLKNMKMKFSDLTAADKAELKGEKGDQGDSAVFDPSSPDAPDFVMANRTGQSTTKAMTQKAVTDEVTMLIKSITGEEIAATNVHWYIYTNKWYPTSSNANGRVIDISAYRGKYISIVSNENNGARIAFLKTKPTATYQDADYCDGTSYIDTPTAGETYSAIVPLDCAYLFVRDKTGLMPVSVNFYESIKEKVSALESDNTAIHAEISAVNAKTRVILQEFTSQQIKATNVQWYISSGKYVTTNANNNARRLVFSEYQGKKVGIIASSNAAHIVFLKTAPTAVGQSADYCEGTSYITLTANTTTELDIPSDCNFLYLRDLVGGQDFMPTKVIVFNQVADEIKEMSTDKPTLIYLSKDGSDDNDGKTSSAPKATFAAAMDAGGKDLRIILLSDLRERLNLSSWNGRKSHLEIMGRHGAMSRIIRGTFLADLEPYEGYDDVYTWTPAEGDSIIPPSTYTKAWLWQHEIPDASTLIPANERHPLQRGRTYRRLSTRLTRVTTLEELLSANSPCWYGDYTNNVLYLRAVAGSDVTENPIVVPSANDIGIQGGNYPITLINVESWYGSIVTSNNFVAKDCAARYNMYEGAWEIDNCKSVYLERCEADSNTMPGTDTGDGFNLHPTHNSGDDPLAKAGTHTLVDCWSHDNRDDGYSDHGKSEGTIIGGLYEHNGKAGLVPAYGSHDTIYNTTCQKNSRGITCLGGQTQDGGNGTQVACYGCVCTDNYYNFSSQGLQGEQVRFILNNCISRNATNAAIFAKDYAEVIVRDCTDSGSPTVKSTSSGATITIDNGTIIS